MIGWAILSVLGLATTSALTIFLGTATADIMSGRWHRRH